MWQDSARAGGEAGRAEETAHRGFISFSSRDNSQGQEAAKPVPAEGGRSQSNSVTGGEAMEAARWSLRR